MTVSYCYHWNALLSTPREPYDEPTARIRHDSGKLYTALLGSPVAPHTAVEVRLEIRSVGVTFFDKKLRPYSTYSFCAVPGEKPLFLNQYRQVRFNESGKKVFSETALFDPDGLVRVRE